MTRNTVLSESTGKNMDQIGVAFTSLIAVWLTQQGNKGLQRYACFFGLAGQPFWFYATYTAEQWGIFMMSIFYTCSWLVGLKRHWFDK